MSYCINPTCPAPDRNSPTTNFCMSCGAKILLKDRYRALKLLGQGGFGKTFKAVDEDRPRKPLCVIKQFAFSNNHPETRQIALKLFYEEAQHLEALGKHDQIPELLAYFDIEGQPYLVQQFIDGQDLEQELATAGTFNQAKIRELLESLLPVLDFLHHQSPPVIHRDIKPANIIRRRSDSGLVLVDFGAAKQATQSMLAKTGTAIGSAEFAAPEQARRKPVFASDIYSLGVTCIYLLTQVSPFDLFDMNQDAWVWRDYLIDNPVDEKLGKVLDKMIANVLPQRYQSASEVLAVLGQKPDRFNTPIDPSKSQSFVEAIDSSRDTPRKEQLKLDAQGVLAAYRRGQRVFTEMDISSLDLSKAQIHGIVLTNSNCADVNFQGANLCGVKFEKADLSGAVLKDAVLSRGYLSYANLQNADLRGADLSDAYLHYANLHGANLCGANLKGVKVTEDQLNRAKTNFMTIFPNGKRGGFW
ncbi:serine/threonine-protein kinase [Chamaesiphon sp. VAR_48_metabat_403]|uniref:serine/threonine-protein kinase n=1 Tax=Chamaesiphon sp. VAR_48_metabat_403 TaxID=2964700 RepID=UPI00286E7265|nr:serine/threonine-protein kinase [Chamaesiphon sp. VAR_48_metabat_403]